VPVFAELTGIPEEQIERELPLALEGKLTANDWMDWLTEKNLRPSTRDGQHDDVIPCVHLVATYRNPISPEHYHWVYRDEEGDVLDPHPVFSGMPPYDERMRTLSAYGPAVLTISITRKEA
jgi:hypothetical protein